MSKNQSKTVGGSLDVNAFHRLHENIWSMLLADKNHRDVIDDDIRDNINDLMRDMFYWSTKDQDKIYRTITAILDKHYVKG